MRHGKHALLGLAALMALSIVVVSNYNSGEKSGRVVLSGNEQEKKSGGLMENPRYFGVDSKNRPFTVTAARATQVNPDVIALTSLQADMLLDESKWLAVSSDTGEILERGAEIRLQKNVSMFYEGGYEFRTDYATIKPDLGYASGAQPVEGQGPSGTLTADSFEVNDHGARLIFRNNVHMTLYLD